MKGSEGPENCTNEREARVLSAFTTQTHPVTVKSSDSQRSRESASEGPVGTHSVGVRPGSVEASAPGADAAGSEPGFETHWARGR